MLVARDTKVEVKVRIQSMLVALLLVAGLSAPAVTAFMCSMSGEVTVQPCCQHEAPTVPSITTADTCCSKIAVDGELPPVRQLADGPDLDFVGMAPVATNIVDPAPVTANSAPLVDHPPPTVPIFLLNCTYLI